MPKNERGDLNVASEMERVFIGLGSNIEPRFDYLRSAINGLRAMGDVLKISSVYETAPVGGVPQADYLNAVAELRTSLGPLELAGRLKALEAALGRAARPRWHEREIDLDLLFYDDLVMSSPELTIPHREIPHRAFVIIPMAEIDPKFVHPILQQTIQELNDEMDTSGVQKADFLLR
ncbi:MAG TPA: 2-amino-4-hydroxy-6-hydroxymethyldihydropteridine diphosphokinase [Candidatus Kapabacteria bacterium]|nr:2-amino-4-hydroxy-6-hydroxymethyldihydropteridine diphosphokinase [Candidatus Kapabacteria bacterium]